MAKAISVRLDDDAEQALRMLEATGLSRSEAIRMSLLASAERMRRRHEVAREAAALEADDVDRAELHAWEVFQTMNWGVMCAGVAEAFAEGSRSIEAVRVGADANIQIPAGAFGGSPTPGSNGRRTRSSSRAARCPGSSSARTACCWRRA